jgi:hypothetical protein
MKKVVFTTTQTVGTIGNLAIQTCPVAPTCGNRISLWGAEC